MAHTYSPDIQETEAAFQDSVTGHTSNNQQQSEKRARRESEHTHAEQTQDLEAVLQTAPDRRWVSIWDRDFKAI